MIDQQRSHVAVRVIIDDSDIKLLLHQVIWLTGFYRKVCLVNLLIFK